MAEPLFPNTVDKLTPELLNAVLQQHHPNAAIEHFDVVQAKSYGEEMVSTAARAILELRYAAGSPEDLPTRVVLKLARDDSKLMAPFYTNEVNFYNWLRPELDVEAPLSLGGTFDPKSGQFGLLLEDLTERGARFPNVTQAVTLTQIESLIDTVATVHAAFWESPRFRKDLSWVESHLQGSVAQLMNEAATPLIQHEIDHENFKREMVQRLRTTGPELRAGMLAVQRHQSTLQQTLLHGDTHLGNTYLLPGDKGGLLDWQLMVRGYCMHDVNYLVTTSLSVEQRRNHEQALLKRYLERLAEQGVRTAPSFDEAWREYRRTLIWGVYIGWLTTPVVNYGWEINVLNHLRLTTAYEDLETQKLVDEVL